MRKTIFLDIDGTIIYHMYTCKSPGKAELLPDVKEKLLEWYRKDYYIVITTARRESCRKSTEKMLNNLGVCYDVLLMGLPRGPRVVINDTKPQETGDNAHRTAIGIVVDRDMGLGGVDV